MLSNQIKFDRAAIDKVTVGRFTENEHCCFYSICLYSYSITISVNPVVEKGDRTAASSSGG